MDSPLVSVLVPCYNAECWLVEALESILAQTLHNFEIIAVDDGSSDGTLRIIEKFATMDSRVRVLRHTTNLGIVAALNNAVSISKGSYIARMDADDIAKPDRLALQLDYLERNNIDICGTCIREFGGGPARILRLPETYNSIHTALLFYNPMIHPTLFGKREMFDRFPYREDFNLSEDYDLLARASPHFKLANIPLVLLDYRRHPAQATMARMLEMDRVARQIRDDLLCSRGIQANDTERELHHSIREHKSINSLDRLLAVEGWLLKLYGLMDGQEAKTMVASQWLRACVRSAPLGIKMWRTFLASPLLQKFPNSPLDSFNLLILAILRLEYRGKAFDILRRFGLSS